MLSGIHNIHFIGIGGAGMSALAHVLCERGFHVSGSDKNAGGICEKLKALGAVVYQGHAAGQVNGADALSCRGGGLATRMQRFGLTAVRQRACPLQPCQAEWRRDRCSADAWWWRG